MENRGKKKITIILTYWVAKIWLQIYILFWNILQILRVFSHCQFSSGILRGTCLIYKHPFPNRPVETSGYPIPLSSTKSSYQILRICDFEKVSFLLILKRQMLRSHDSWKTLIRKFTLVFSFLVYHLSW